MLVDYHCHLAPDSERLGPRWMTPEHVAGYAAAARARGVAELALTEHGHRFLQASGISEHPFWNETAHADLDAYVDVLAAARDEGLPLRVGIELDWLGATYVDALRALVADRDLDIVLGSVHWLAGEMVDHPDYPIWQTHSVAEVWRLYFEQLRAAASSGLYDVMAHPDLPKVFGTAAARRRPPAGVRRHGRCVRRGGGRVRDLDGGAAQAGGRAVSGPRLPEARAPLAACRSRSPPTHIALRTSVETSSSPCGLAADAGYRTVTAFRAREPRQEPLG